MVAEQQLGVVCPCCAFRLEDNNHAPVGGYMPNCSYTDSKTLCVDVLVYRRGIFDLEIDGSTSVPIEMNMFVVSALLH